jgi:hypothetical protein
MGIDCWGYTVATHRPVPFYPVAAPRCRDCHPDVDLLGLLEEAAAFVVQTPNVRRPLLLTDIAH